MPSGRGSVALLTFLPVLWVGGCSTPVSPGEELTSGPVTREGPVVPEGSVTQQTPVSPEASETPDRVTVRGGAPPDRVVAYEVMTEAALDRVEDLWGRGAVRWPVRVVLPESAAEFADLTGDAPASQEAPAVTVGSLAEAHVVVHPDSWGRLTPEGRQAVLIHEVTHLAQQDRGPVPPWLGEGTAEFTAHRQSDLPLTTIAGSALDDVRAGRLPSTWPDPTSRSEATGPTSVTEPTDATGQPHTAGQTGTGSVWDGYALSWLACQYIVETWSEEALLELYDTVAGGTPVHEALPVVLDVTEDEALIGWSDWLHTLVG